MPTNGPIQADEDPTFLPGLAFVLDFVLSPIDTLHDRVECVQAIGIMTVEPERPRTMAMFASE
ncbi:MAG: hypothetical protein K1X57_01030 [Gemmataceae bacterium]|nr:hypothetical protein [Gemmataceae bacterium]